MEKMNIFLEFVRGIFHFFVFLISFYVHHDGRDDACGHLVRFFFLSGPDADVAADEVDVESVAPAAAALRSTKYSGCVCRESESENRYQVRRGDPGRIPS